MLEEIMIASVTKMAKGLCIGGYVMPQGWRPSEFALGPTRSVRLIPAGARWHSYTNDWQPGQIITAEISERAGLVLPHAEDVTLLRWGNRGCGRAKHEADSPCTCARAQANYSASGRSFAVMLEPNRQARRECSALEPAFGQRRALQNFVTARFPPGLLLRRYNARRHQFREIPPQTAGAALCAGLRSARSARWCSFGAH